MILTQVPLILFIGASFDLIFGFNRTDAGFAVLLLLLLLVPLINLAWVTVEVIRSAKLSRRAGAATGFLWPIVATLFLCEAVTIDLYAASQAGM